MDLQLSRLELLRHYIFCVDLAIKQFFFVLDRVDFGLQRQNLVTRLPTLQNAATVNALLAVKQAKTQ